MWSRTARSLWWTNYRPSDDFGRRYNEGLHQAIEAKEGVKIAAESKTLATITFQNYFRMYEKLSGMTGTAKTEATEFTEILWPEYRHCAHQPPQHPSGLPGCGL